MISEPIIPKLTKRVHSSLAGYNFSVEFEAEVAHLCNAFTNLKAEGDTIESLKAFVSVDPKKLDSVLQWVESGSFHQRYGDSHIWLSSQPRHLEWLSPISFGSHKISEAKVIFDRSEGLDGSLSARPCRETISLWAANLGIIPIHASCIALGGRALLMLGKGGSGKTTTALALAKRGWDLLADDLCFIYHDGPQTMVASLYATTLVTQNSLNRLQASLWEDLGNTHHGKSARRLPPNINIVTEAELAGMVWVSQNVGDLYKPKFLNRSQALVPLQAAFAPALQARGPSENLVNQLAGLSRSAPTWNMRLDWEFDKIDHALRELINRTSTLCV